jgi:hypothetical protein
MKIDRILKIDNFVKSMDRFISGDQRGTIFVREIEGMFAELFDDDDQFSDLQYSLAMFGAGKNSGTDEAMLVQEFKRAKEIILKTRI